MHGLGNDYVFVNTFEEDVIDPSALARALSDRHTGVGSDGLILIAPSNEADVRMEVYNSDGSRAEMCGNGIRCVAKYAIEHGLAVGPAIRIETAAGGAHASWNPESTPGRDLDCGARVKIAACHLDGGIVHSVRVDMGRPVLSASEIPSTIARDRVIDHPLHVGGGEYLVTCVSMGNPHVVVFAEDLEPIELEVIGPLFERAPEFPERINTHFAQVDSPEHVTMISWERGSGMTRACGTGACAVCVAGVVTERTGKRMIAALPGGDLELEWADDGHVYMTGPAVEVFTGEWNG